MAQKKVALEFIKTTSLFGHFDYEVDLRKCSNGITILTAPNGYGKSTILKIIESVAIGDYLAFLDIDFQEIELKFETLDPIYFKKHLSGKSEVTVIINYKDQSFVINTISDIWNSPDGPGLERLLPITKVGPRTYRDDRFGEIMDRAEVIHKFRNHPMIRNKMRSVKWFEELREQFDIFPITVNRLKLELEESMRFPDVRRTQLMVSAISDSIKVAIANGIKAQFEKGRELEASFPRRLISSLSGPTNVNKESILGLINKIKSYEERYSKHGILPKVSTTELLRYELDDSNSAPFFVLNTYLQDICDKFAQLESLATKLDVFLDSINQLLSFKKMKASAADGLTVELKYNKKHQEIDQQVLFKDDSDKNKNEISLTTLSSGEQHLLILFGQLVFNVSPTTLVLIDEPELSLHPEWQERFIPILENIRAVTSFNALIATHSPLLIGSRWEDVIELAEQGGYDE